MKQLLTHSRLSTFRSCPRKHQIRYEVGIAPEQDDLGLRVGTAFHAAKEAQDLGKDPVAAINELGTLDVYDAAMVAAMVTVHTEMWQGQTLEVVATEIAFDLPLRNPATGAASHLWRMGGKIDRIYRLPSGSLAIQDYKTANEDIGPEADLWLRLSLDQQMGIYVMAARELGHDVQTILYDVTRRPMQRPQLATPEAERKYTQKATKLADGTIRPAGSLYAGQRDRDETPEEFAARVAEAMRAEPAKYFARHEIARLDSDLDETRAEIWQQQRAIREMQLSGDWYRNPGSCVSPYRCPYLAICGRDPKRLAENVPDGYRLLADVHPELSAAQN